MAGELPDLRVAAAMGFGRYDRTNFTNATQTVSTLTQEVPLVGGGKAFQLIGYLHCLDVPPDLLLYQWDYDVVNAATMLRAESIRTPIMALLTPERPKVVINLQLGQWLAPYNGSAAVSIDTLTGQVEQLKALYRWLAAKQAPASLTETVFQGIEDLAGAAVGDWY